MPDMEKPTPCDTCIYMECEENGVVCPLWEKYQKPLFEKDNMKE